MRNQNGQIIIPTDLPSFDEYGKCDELCGKILIYHVIELTFIDILLICSMNLCKVIRIKQQGIT